MMHKLFIITKDEVYQKVIVLFLHLKIKNLSYKNVTLKSITMVNVKIIKLCYKTIKYMLHFY